MGPHLRSSHIRWQFPLVSLAAAAATTPFPTPRCLNGAIPSASRRLLVDPVEGRIPLRLWALNWDSATLAEFIYRTLAEEILGYVVEVSGLGSASTSGVYALAGCQRPDNFHTDPRCLPGGVQHHLTLEVWWTAAISYQETMSRDHPAREPVSLGSIGYKGVETLFVLGNTSDRAYAQEGLPLDYYRSYDPTWHNVSRYFDSFTSISMNSLRPCADTLMANAEDMNNYVRFSGDLDGVVLKDGEWQARCWGDRWWFAPACRTTPTRCVPILTGGSGWFVYAIMSVATRLQIPLAVATAASFPDYISIPRQSEGLLYWWTPDVSFVDLRPQEITFPRFEKGKWMAGDKASVSREVPLYKLAYQGLSKIAPQLFMLAESFELSKDQIDQLLFNLKTTGEAPAQVACTWLRTHESTWRRWIPRPTACVLGQGLVNAGGDFVEARANATSCTRCNGGYVSGPMTDALGKTHKCIACTAGKSQDERGSTECTRCNTGYYASTPGMLSCLRCPQGRFQPTQGSSACEVCPHPLTTNGLGSTRASECICPANTYRMGAVCAPCPPGFSCPLGSDLSNMPCAAGAPAPGHPGPWPVPEPSHVAFCSDPTQAYRCLQANACPGGGMGRCGPHMSGIACGLCSQGYTWRRGECTECWIQSLGVWIACLALGGPFAYGVLHVLSMKRADMRYGFTDTLLCMGFLIMVEAQVVVIMLSCDVTIDGEFNSMMSLVSRVVDVISGMSNPTCFAGLDFVGSFVFNALRPLTGLFVGILTYGSAELAGRLLPRLRLDWNVGLSTYGGLYFIFFIGVAKQGVSLWHCYGHPDGVRRSMYDAPHILCGSPSWRELLALAVAACLVFCVGFMALVCYGVCVAPMQVAKADFRIRWRFLFVRFRSCCWWWGVVLMLRALWLCLATTIFDTGVGQLIWVQVMLVTYAMSCGFMMPWKSLAVTALDVCTHFFLILMCSSLLAHASEPSGGGSVTCAVLFLCPVLLAGVLVLYATAQSFTQAGSRPTAKWHVRAEHLQKVFEEASHTEGMGFILSRLPLADLRLLVQAKHLLAAEVLGQQVRLPRRSCTASVLRGPNFEGHWRPAFRTESFADALAAAASSTDAVDVEDLEEQRGSREAWGSSQQPSPAAEQAAQREQPPPRRLKDIVGRLSPEEDETDLPNFLRTLDQGGDSDQSALPRRLPGLHSENLPHASAPRQGFGQSFSSVVPNSEVTPSVAGDSVPGTLPPGCATEDSIRPEQGIGSGETALLS